jgi:hypothetical protein
MTSCGAFIASSITLPANPTATTQTTIFNLNLILFNWSQSNLIYTSTIEHFWYQSALTLVLENICGTNRHFKLKLNLM